MLKDYVLGVEICAAGDMHIGNISMTIKDTCMIDGIDYLKFGGVVLLNKNSDKLPNNLVQIIENNDMTDLSEYIPYMYIHSLCEGNVSKINKRLERKNISGKQFVKVIDKELKEVLFNESLIKSTIDSSEVDSLVEDKSIKGYLKLNNSKSLCWY